MAAAPDDPRAGLPAHRAAGFDRLLGIVAAATLFFIMALTCADVAGRYFFGAPIPGGFEITELAMGALEETLEKDDVGKIKGGIRT